MATRNPATNKFAIPQMKQPDTTQEAFDKEFQMIADRNTDLAGLGQSVLAEVEVRDGEVRNVPLNETDAARWHIDQIYANQKRIEAHRISMPEQINLAEEDESSNWLDVARQDEQTAARGVAMDMAHAASETQIGDEVAPLTPEQIRGYTNSLKAFRDVTLQAANPDQARVIGTNDQWGLAA